MRIPTVTTAERDALITWRDSPCIVYNSTVDAIQAWDGESWFSVGSGGGGPHTHAIADIVPPSGGGTTNFLRADGAWASPGAGGGSTVAEGRVSLDFGSFPGSGDASIAVTGQTGFLTTHNPTAYLVAVATADHTADEHRLARFDLVCGNFIAGTGFTIYASLRTDPVIQPQTGAGRVRAALETPRTYGLWSVAWRYVI